MDKLLIIAFGIMVYSSIILISNFISARKDSVRRRISDIAKISSKGVLEDDELSKPLTERIVKPLINQLMQNLNKYIPDKMKGENANNNPNAGKLRRTLRQAGIKMSAHEYRLLRMIVMAGTAVFAAMIAIFMRIGAFAVVFAAAMGVYGTYAVFLFDLSSRISRRRASMEKQMPEVLDMMSVSVEAGLGLEQSMLSVVNNFDGPLIDEISVSNREMAMGRSRRDALLNLGERCELEEIKSFVRAIVQAGELGISIKNVLRSQSAFMRQSRRNKIEEKAMKISVKILIPMVLFIFPVLFIVLLGPAAVSIADALL